MNLEDVAASLDVLASRVRRMAPQDRTEIAHELARLARSVAPRHRPASAVSVDVSDTRRGRIVATTQTVNGRRIVVQTRRPFTIYVGERPIKPD